MNRAVTHNGSLASERVLTDDERATIESYVQPTIRLAGGGSGFSRIGGRPNLPDSFAWPCDGDEPLAFMCQIACDELPSLAVELGLPKAGALFFFFDRNMQGWGFDPAHARKWRMIYTPSTPGDVAERASPSGPGAKVYSPQPIAFTVAKSYPDAFVFEIDIAAFGAYWRFRNPPTERGDATPPRHRIGGYPDSLDDFDMAHMCEAVSHGLRLYSATDWCTPEVAAFSAGSARWKLLLQLDSDQALGMVWDEMIRLYVWIQEDDLNHARFDKVWTVIQTAGPSGRQG